MLLVNVLARVLISFLVLIAALGVGFWPSPTHADTYPDLNIAALAYGRDQSFSPAECAEMGRKFDVLLEGRECYSIIKSINPASVILAYINSSNCTKGDDVCNYLESLEHPEDYFLNFTSDGVQQIDDKKIKRNKGQRVCAYGAGCTDGVKGTRWTTDYISEQSRNVIAGFLLNKKNLPKNADGWFVDNMDRGCSYSGRVASGTVEYSLENDNNGSLDASPRMEQSCNKLRKQVMDGAGLDLYIVDNISNWGITTCGGTYWWQVCTNEHGKLSRKYAEGVLVTPGVLQEFFYRITGNYEDFATHYDGLREIWNYRGKKKNNLFIMWYIAAGVGDIPANSDRVKMFALGTHLLFQFPAAYIRYDGQNRNNTPLIGDWFDAMGAPFGKAKGERIAIEAGRVYRRQFDNSIVVVRFRKGWNDNYTNEGIYDLGGDYFPLKADGSFAESAVSKITLRNSEAFIGIKNKP